MAGHWRSCRSHTQDLENPGTTGMPLCSTQVPIRLGLLPLLNSHIYSLPVTEELRVVNKIPQVFKLRLICRSKHSLDAWTSVPRILNSLTGWRILGFEVHPAGRWKVWDRLIPIDPGSLFLNLDNIFRNSKATSPSSMFSVNAMHFIISQTSMHVYR